MNTITRPSLGQYVPLGTLYDARTESFLSSSLLSTHNPSPSTETEAEAETETKPIPTDSITSTPLTKSTKTIIKTTSIDERFKALSITPDLAASLLAELVHPHCGSSQYLAQQGDTVPAVHRGVVYTVEGRAEELRFMGGGLREVLDLNVLEGSQATHVITGVVWGARAVVSAQRRVLSGEERGDVEGIVEEAVGFVSGEGKGYKWLDLENQQQQQPKDEVDDTLRVRMYTDAREIFTGQTDNISDAAEHFGQLQGHVQRTGGVPLMYTLLPVTYLSMLGAILPNNVITGQMSKECYDQVVGLADHLACLQRTLNVHHHRLVQHRGLVTDSHFERVKEEARKAMKAEEQFRVAYSAALPTVRDGTATSQVVVDIVNQAKSDILGPNELNDLTSTYDNKLEFLSRMVQMGAIFPEDAKSKPQEVIDRTAISSNSFYVFHFSDAMDTSCDSWNENQQLLEGLLTQQPKPRVLLIDWDTQRPDLTQPYITQHANGSIVVENLLDQHKDLADKHLVKYDRAYLEATTDVPSYRKSLRIPCPGPHCDEQNLCLWSCVDCHETVEFGSRDGFFYCDCGRVPFHKSAFNCQGPYHKDKERVKDKSTSDFYQFDRATLRDLLLSLPEPREVNILILGETGVGKSTFVNAFVNYLTFNSLDDGLKDPKLNCIIPCSFTTQVVDGQTGRMISRDVVVGRDKDEADGSKGSSATQKATVYPLYFKDTLIRLIDTPGIGDTRGLDQDKQNMANMLSILRNYPSLHGILILLKPNNARLGVMFRFCVKELLTHLHTSAAQNMVFGFTNTRGSNYTPGDTFKPLESLLSSYQDVIPQLSRDNVYCFDSESFRYLAARKQGIEMGHEDDYRRSWEHSAAEADRLLEHFQGLRPHHTQETLSLNETRHLIAQLTAPMQQISVAIGDTIVKNVKQVAELRDAEGTMAGLQGKLQIHKTNVSAQQLEKPKTVCANPKCVEAVFDEAKNEKVLLRKKLCHNPCCLTNVPVGQVGTPQLQNCFAFNGEYCSVCGHRWDEHEHILVEYAKSEETVIDANVQRELNTTGSLVKAKKSAIAAIERNIAELKTEHAAVQTAAARFSLYLKHNSITHYNDATVEYLEHLIKDEKTKVRTGDSRQRLEALEKDLDNYKKFVDAMEQKDKSSSSAHAYTPLNEAGVAKLVQSLYNLPHYGQMLKDLAQVVASAYEANFRERPYRISHRKYWRGRDFQHQGTGKPLVKKQRAISPGTAANLGRTFMPGAGPSDLEQTAGAIWEADNEFWPTAATTSTRTAPVRSIMDMNGEASISEKGIGSGTGQRLANEFSAPPPYPGPRAQGTQLNGQLVNGSEPEKEVEKKGMWLRLKDKLRKK